MVINEFHFFLPARLNKVVFITSKFCTFENIKFFQYTQNHTKNHSLYINIQAVITNKYIETMRNL